MPVTRGFTRIMLVIFVLMLAGKAGAITPEQVNACISASKRTPSTFQHIKSSAELGDAESQNNLGLMYENSHGVPQDYVQAAHWYLKAAEQGVAAGTVQSGCAVRQWPGCVPQDDVQAMKWFIIAKANGHMQAEQGQKAIKRLSVAQLVEARKMALEWRPVRRPEN